MAAWWTVAVLLLLAVPPGQGQEQPPELYGMRWQTPLKTLFVGEGTFYGQQDGQNHFAACSWGKDFSDTLDLPWTAGVQTFIALNKFMFANSNGCGMCVMYRGRGQDRENCPRCGMTPITTDWKYGFVDNQCPDGTCKWGDLDQNLPGDGRWQIEWYPVPCNGVGNSSLVYSVYPHSITPEWFMFGISNHRVPVQSVEMWVKSSWYKLDRNPDNHWAVQMVNNERYQFPIKLRITSVLGDAVEDTLNSIDGNTGTVQFPNRGAAGVFNLYGASTLPNGTPMSQIPTATPTSDQPDGTANYNGVVSTTPAPASTPSMGSVVPVPRAGSIVGVESRAYTKATSGSSDGNRTAIIVGATVGGFFGLLLGAGIVFGIVRTCRRRAASSEATNAAAPSEKAQVAGQVGPRDTVLKIDATAGQRGQ